MATPSDRSHRHHSPRVPAANAVPTPQSQQHGDPRTLELAQLDRRFNIGRGGARWSAEDTAFVVNLKPSDPDFVYSIDVLRMRLTVPLQYRQSAAGKPSIEVLNADIPAGYRINVERGFAALVEAKPDLPLLALMNSLDRRLEAILSGEKAETVKIVPNLVTSPPAIPRLATATTAPPVAPLAPAAPAAAAPTPVVAAVAAEKSPTAAKPAPPVATSEQRAAAAARRTLETRQLESRLKLSEVFRKSTDGTEYVVPLDSRRQDLLPVPLLAVRSVRLLVPPAYDLHPARIELASSVPEAIRLRVQSGFAAFVEANRRVSLTAAVNFLGARVHIWAAQEDEAEGQAKGKRDGHKGKAREEKGLEEVVVVVEEDPAAIVGRMGAPPNDMLHDKSHVKVIPRPPEWLLSCDDSDDDDDDDDDEYTDSEGNNTAEEEAARDRHAAGAGDVPHAVPEHGTSLSCPGIHTSGIELLEVLALNVVIKCSRCKTEREVLNLRGSPPGTAAKPHAFRCEKCSEILGIGFRKDFIHQSSHRLGFFDLTHCTVAEILPSAFTPQCSSCSSPLPGPGVKDLVRGQSVSTNCRECHQKLGLYIPEFKLLRITPGDDLNLGGLPLKVKTKERYVAGTELPRKGRCKHYRKSTRWFRFSCCSKVFPCDRCHDETENHPSEHANRMICGLCSREQNYRPEDCRFCGNAFCARKLSHYWEGGKGTRDKRLMARNDPRKYKRMGRPVE